MLKASCGKVLEDMRGRKPDGCMDSFLYSLDSSQEVLGSVEIVKCYSYIFEPVNSLPPHQEIEFCDLAGARHVFYMLNRRICY